MKSAHWVKKLNFIEKLSIGFKSSCKTVHSCKKKILFLSFKYLFSALISIFHSLYLSTLINFFYGPLVIKTFISSKKVTQNATKNSTILVKKIKMNSFWITINAVLHEVAELFSYLVFQIWDFKYVLKSVLLRE